MTFLGDDSYPRYVRQAPYWLIGVKAFLSCWRFKHGHLMQGCWMLLERHLLCWNSIPSKSAQIVDLMQSDCQAREFLDGGWNFSLLANNKLNNRH